MAREQVPELMSSTLFGRHRLIELTITRLPEPPHLFLIDSSEMQLEIIGTLAAKRHYSVGERTQRVHT
jgi:hypothetical protein